MAASSFQSGRAVVGSKEREFTKRTVAGRFTLYVPVDFSQDPKLVSNYTYLFSRDQSPLGIAVKFSPAESESDVLRLGGHYFGQPAEALDQIEGRWGRILYRDMVVGGEQISIYSLRFSVEAPGGLLFGCFNCLADAKDAWKPVVLAMLQEIEEK